jgi:protocatechuate 3,4-dioxygenase beta subunit
VKTSRALAALLFITLACALNSAAGARAQESVVVQSDIPKPQAAQTTSPQNAATAAARADKTDKTKRAADTITGRVLGEGGEPLGGISVAAIPRSFTPNYRAPHTALTDDEGGFRVVGLEPGIYSVSASVPGYVTEPDPLTGRVGGEYKPGDPATVRLVKGGVITGAATDAQGEPLVALGVRAYRVRDLDGRLPPPNAVYVGAGRTDDRGVYRIYGLQPGAYVVLAGGPSSASFGLASPYGADAPTFYPSSTRDTAAEVTVRAGAEAAGVDIRYRDEPGHRVTGKVEFQTPPSDPTNSVGLILSYASSNIQAATDYLNLSASGISFSFEGITDGDYDLQASITGRDGLVSVAPPQRVTVRGADVSGLRVTLAPLASVSGTLAVEPATEAERARAGCEGAHAPLPPQETLITATFDRAASAKAQPAPRFSLTREATPDDAGAFTLRSLEAGRYRLSVHPFDENLYVRSIQLPGANAPATPAAPRTNIATQGTTRAAAAAAPPAREVLDIRSGQQLSGVVVRLAEGASALSGHVFAADGAQAPPYASLRVHLLPAEREHADDPLRFFETTPGADGAFSFKSLPPGRYLLLARVVADAHEAAPRPAFRDADARASLRREAEAAGTTVELQPCRRTSDFALRFPPPAPK